MTVESSTSASRRIRLSPIRYRLLAVAVAAVAAAAVWIVATLAGAHLSVTSPLAGTIAINLPLVILTSVVVGFAAWGVLAILVRRVRNGRRLWSVIAVAVLLVSVLAVLVLDTAAETKVALGLIHVAVGLPLAVMLPRDSARRRA